jgi:hypothetical protein
VAPGSFGAEAIVQIWERGRHEHPVDRALTILGVLSGRPRRELAELSLERRDGRLLGWRSRLFGLGLVGYAECPRCGSGVDVSVTLPAPPDDATDEPFAVETGRSTVVVRMPTSLDLAAAAACESVDAARRVLLQRCVDGPASGDELLHDDELLAAVERELDRRAVLSGGFVTAFCPECSHDWSVELDVATFVWREIEILAARLLRDVDVLACRYGWSEREILGLGADRRRFYLELAS